MSDSAAVRSRPGPKTDLTPSVQEIICNFVMAGATIPVACEAAGIQWSTAKNWIHKGKRGLEPYDGFVAALSKSKAMHKVALHMVITSAAKKGDWRAALAAHDLIDRRSRAQKERDGAATPPDVLDERVVLLYPVPVPEGASLRDLHLHEGHAIDTTAEDVPAVTVTYEEIDHDD